MRGCYSGNFKKIFVRPLFWNGWLFFLKCLHNISYGKVHLHAKFEKYILFHYVFAFFKHIHTDWQKAIFANSWLLLGICSTITEEPAEHQPHFHILPLRRFIVDIASESVMSTIPDWQADLNIRIEAPKAITKLTLNSPRKFIKKWICDFTLLSFLSEQIFVRIGFRKHNIFVFGE